MMSQLHSQGKDQEKNADRQGALAVYNGLTSTSQKQAFIADFFSEEKGKAGKNVKCMVEWSQKIVIEQEAKVEATEIFFARPCLLQCPSKDL